MTLSFGELGSCLETGWKQTEDGYVTMTDCQLWCLIIWLGNGLALCSRVIFAQYQRQRGHNCGVLGNVDQFSY